MDLVKIRKDLHQIPELGRCEYKTKEYILAIAKKLRCEVFEPTPTGVTLFFNCQKAKTICFRADMDGLPIEEKTGLPFSSKHSGAMHACAHDGHMTMLIGFALWASENLDKLQHNVLCLFQPSEEENAGARDIINSTVLKKYSVKNVFGMHIWPSLEQGELYTMPKGMLATSAEVNITIYGKTVHAANRDKGIDALLIATRLITSFYKEMEKLKSPHLISFGKIEAGTARNTVADRARIYATMRAFDDDVFLYMKNSLRNLTIALEKEFSTKIELEICCNYPSVMNAPELVEKYQKALNLRILKEPFLQAEDFGWYTRAYPSLFLLLGCGNTEALHSNCFDFDMDILSVGVETYKKIACME